MTNPWWRRVLCGFGVCFGHLVSRPDDTYTSPVFLCDYCGKVER